MSFFPSLFRCALPQHDRADPRQHCPASEEEQTAKEAGRAVDATQGRKTKSVIMMENNQVVLSALLPETIAGRVQAGAESIEEECE